MRALSVLFYLLVTYSPTAASLELIISPRLAMEYGKPKGILHSPPAVLAYYDDDAVLSHEVIVPNEIYNGEPDLTGHLACFIQNMFGEACSHPLPKHLKSFSDEQAKALGINTNDGKVAKYQIEEIKILAVYNYKSNIGFAYIFDQNIIHSINVLRSSDEFFFQAIQTIFTRH